MHALLAALVPGKPPHPFIISPASMASQLKSAEGLGCVKTRWRGKLIEQISLWIGKFSDDNFSARSILSRSEKAILLVLDRAGFLHRQGQEWSNSNQSPGVDMFCRPMGGTVPRAEVPEALWAQARGSGFAAPDDLWSDCTKYCSTSHLHRSAVRCVRLNSQRRGGDHSALLCRVT